MLKTWMLDYLGLLASAAKSMGGLKAVKNLLPLFVGFIQCLKDFITYNALERLLKPLQAFKTTNNQLRPHLWQHARNPQQLSPLTNLLPRRHPSWKKRHLRLLLWMCKV